EIPGEGVICPWTTPLAYATQALAAGARLRLRSRVTGIRTGAALGGVVGPEPAEHQVVTGTGVVRCRWVVNAAGLYSDTIDAMMGGGEFTICPRRGELIVFDKLARPLLSSILLPVPTARTKGVLVAPTVYGNVLLGPTAEDIPDRGDVATTGPGLASLMEAGRRGYYNWLGPFMLATLLGAYTIVGFESASNLAEETFEPHRTVPRAMVRAVVLSGVVGMAFLIALVYS